MKKKLSALVVLVLVVLGMGVGVYTFSNQFFNKPKENQYHLPNKDENQSGKEKEQDKEIPDSETIEDAKGDITFLLMGVDDGDRTDTMMVCKYFADTEKISVLSIPRDTRTLIPGYGLDKINHAHVYGGANLSLASVNNLLDMGIKYHVRVDYSLVKEIVDTLGGIEVKVPDGIEGLDAGLQTLNGTQAELFLRHRKGYYNQDLGRIGAQQEFLKSLIVKVSETRDLAKLSSIAKSSLENVETNIPLRTVLGYTLRLRGMDTAKVQMETLSGSPAMIGKVSYILVDEAGIPEVVERLFGL